MRSEYFSLLLLGWATCWIVAVSIITITRRARGMVRVTLTVLAVVLAILAIGWAYPMIA